MRRYIVLVGVLCAVCLPAAQSHPFDKGQFKGRIAYSCDGNHNDPDDWIASPVALAIFAEAGLKDRVVHFDYDSILPLSKPDWEKIHADSVLGGAKRYGYDLKRFFDDRRDLDGAIASIVRVINASSADDPLYFIIAGPMEVPVRALQKADPAKLKYVYCISHSRWNDGYQASYQFSFTKRSVVEQGVHWVQIADQNRLLSRSRYGNPAKPEEFAPYFWMRDSRDPNVKFLWERMVISTRPDPSDAGMAWFLVTGDEQCDPAKLKSMLENHQRTAPITVREKVRIEAENFRHLEGFAVEDRSKDRATSHRLAVRLDGAARATMRIRYDEPFAPRTGRFDIEIRYLSEKGGTARFSFSVNGTPAGPPWTVKDEDHEWTSRVLEGVELKVGDELGLEVEGASARVDYVQLAARDLSTVPAAHAQTRGAGATEQTAPASPRMPLADTAKLDDPQAMPGGLIVAGKNPGYLKYNGGGPVFLSGPDNPEEFLYLGTLNPDGTRSGGGQEEMIARLATSGVNAFHCLIFRMQRCNIKKEGDDQHCPFVDHDPAKPLNEAVLAQWEGWLTALERAGVNVHFEFYNDATDVELMGWKLDATGNLHPDEHRFITGIVQRFKHHKNLLWGIEESGNKLPRDRVPHFKKIAAVIAAADNFHHPIVQSFVVPNDPEGDFPKDGVTTDDYVGDPNIRVVTWLHVVPNGKDYDKQHAAYLEFARKDRARFVTMKNETFHHPRKGPESRRYMWSCAMTGLHTLEAYHHAGGPRVADDATLREDGLVRRFMEQTDFYRMESNDALAAGSTKWVLARPGESYIAYTFDCWGPMALREMPLGTYDLLWFDTQTGTQVEQKGVAVSANNLSWPKPASMGNEIALYLKRSDARSPATTMAKP